MDDKYHIALLERFLQGVSTDEEDRQLKHWIKDPAARAVCYAYYQQQWDNAPDNIDSNLQAEMLAGLLSRIDTGNDNDIAIEEKVTRRPAKIAALVRYAAAACVLLAIGIGAYYWGAKTDAAGNVVTMHVDNGQKADVTLADGTIVHLNAGTTISYNNAYNKTDRIINLNGEAYFDVAKNKEKPFIVKAGGLSVQALGTSFNVRAPGVAKSVAVTLIEGKVKVADNAHSLIMHPNDRIEYNVNSKRFSKTIIHPNSNKLLWRSSELTFYGETLEEICQILSRMYGTRFEFKNEDVKKYTFTGVIKDNSLTNVLEFVTLSASVKYKIKPDNTVEIAPE